MLGGPLGLLLGWSTGALVGSVIDLDRADAEEGAMTKLGGEVTRRPRDEVSSNIGR